MSGRRDRESRRQERELEELLATLEMSMFEAIEPDDPRFAALDPGTTQRTIEEAVMSGDFHPDCPLCQSLVMHEGPSILTRVVLRGPRDN
jgi:hypothetical protein